MNSRTLGMRDGEVNSPAELARSIAYDLEELALRLEAMTEHHPDWSFLLEQFHALNQLYEELMEQTTGLTRDF